MHACSSDGELGASAVVGAHEAAVIANEEDRLAYLFVQFKNGFFVQAVLLTVVEFSICRTRRPPCDVKRRSPIERPSTWAATTRSSITWRTEACRLLGAGCGILVRAERSDTLKQSLKLCRLGLIHVII
jgi:hypothetical protein